MAARPSTEESLRIVLDHMMLFMHVRSAVHLRLVSSSWNRAIDDILNRGPFDCRVPSMSWAEAETAIRRIPEKEVQENSRICEALAVGCLDPVLSLLKKRPFNMPLFNRSRVWLQGYAGNADCFSPIQRFLSSAGLMYSFKSKRNATPTWCIFRLKDPEYFNALERPNEELRKYAELISWNDGTVEAKDFLAAAQNDKCYNLWFEQITAGLKVFRSEGWLHPSLPLIVYALSSMTQYFHLPTVEKLVDILLDEYKCDVNGCRFSTGATALHEVCGLYGISTVAVPLAKLLVKRGASWTKRTKEKVNDFPIGITPLEILKEHLKVDDEKWPKDLNRAEVQDYAREIEATLVGTSGHSPESSAPSTSVAS